MSFSSLLTVALPSPTTTSESIRRKARSAAALRNRNTLDLCSLFTGEKVLSNSNTKSDKGARRSFCCKSQLSELAPATSAAYGTLLLGGGLFAFQRSRSKGSLYGGLTGAALMAAAYFLTQAPETKAAGDALGFGSAFLFSCIFGIRLTATRKAVPAGPLLGLSLGALTVFVLAYLQDTI